MISPDRQAKLGAKLPSHEVMTRQGPGGQSLSYVSGIYVINKMNEIFGAGGWAYEATVQRESLEQGADGKWRAVYSSRCVLTFDGALGPIVDYGAGNKKGSEIGEVIEHAIKEAVTDSLKRCCKSLGHCMGGALYEPTGQHVGFDPSEILSAMESATTEADFTAATRLYRQNAGKLSGPDEDRIIAAGKAARERITPKKEK
jgi:hypothetical protein